MPTLDEFRSRLIEDLAFSCTRPGMSFGEWHLDVRLHDLAYIDSREDELKVEVQRLREHSLALAGGVGHGILHRIWRLTETTKLLKYDSFTNEAASAYAEVACRMGYLKVARLLDEYEWRQLKEGIRHSCRHCDLRANDVTAAFGPPSLTIGGNWNRVLCYASTARSEGWICFDHEIVGDLFRDAQGNDPVRAGGEAFRKIGVENPPLRDVRRWTTRSFRMLFTPYGKRYLTLLRQAAASTNQGGDAPA